MRGSEDVRGRLSLSQRSVGGSAFILLAALEIGCGTAVAQEWKAGATASAEAEYAKNPYLTEGKGSSYASASLDLRPFVTYTDGRTQIRLEGRAELTQFNKDLGLEDNYQATLQLIRQLSSRLELTSAVSADYTEARLGALRRLQDAGASPGAGPQLPELDPAIPDVTVLGGRTRSKGLWGTAGLGLQMDDRNRLEADVRASGQWFVDPSYDDYKSYGGEARYLRVLDSRLSIGLIGGVTFTEYDGTNAIKSGRSILTMATAQMQFNSRWKATLDAGMSFSRVKGTVGQLSSTFNSLSLRGSVCRNTTRVRFCGRVQRMPQPTAFGGIRVSTSAMLDHSIRLSESNQLTTSASYVRTSQGRGPVLGFSKIEFFGGNARFEHRLNQRLSAFAAATAGKLRQNGLKRDASLSISAGISIKLGSIR